MELPFYFVTSLLLLFFLSNRFLWKQATHSIFNLPPGPQTLPFIGSLHHQAGRLPHHALSDLARFHGPIMLLRADDTDLVILTSHEAAEEVLQTQDANLANNTTIYATNVLMYGNVCLGEDEKMRRRVARLHSKMDLVLEEIVQEHLKNRQQQKKRGEADQIEYDFVDVLIDVHMQDQSHLRTLIRFTSTSNELEEEVENYGGIGVEMG